AGSQPVFGDVRDTGPDRAPRIAASHAPPTDLDRPPGRRAHTDDRLGQLPLAVTGHSRDRNDLAPPNLERYLVDSRNSAVTVGADAVESEHDVAHRRSIFVTPPDLDLTADHQGGQRPWRRLCSRSRRNGTPAAKDGHSIGDRFHLVELV